MYFGFEDLVYVELYFFKNLVFREFSFFLIFMFLVYFLGDVGEVVIKLGKVGGRVGRKKVDCGIGVVLG